MKTGWLNCKTTKGSKAEMDKIDFDTKRIAEGYLNRPWLHKKVIERFINDYQISTHFHNGLDVGCGAGLSTKALRLICNQVTGTGISEQMIQVCKEAYKNDEGYTFYQAKAEETKEPMEKYDIVTAAGMVNWVDRDIFLQLMNQIMQEQGVLLIYDFWITDKMQGSRKYTKWYQNEYLKRFPKPSRNENIWKQEEVSEYDFKIKKQINYEVTYDFSMEHFIDFMMIQSNVNAKIEDGTITEPQAREWFGKTLAPVFEDNVQTLLFQGYYWYMQLCDENNYKK